VPTLAVAKGLTQHAASLGLRQINIDKLQGVFEPIMGSMEILKRAGVKVGLGTDVSGQLAPLQTSEFTLRAEIFSNHEILVSATSLAAEILREDGRLGIVAPGAHADLIVVDGDPLRDVRVLDRAGATVPLVMKAGHIHKNLI
jgi:imidazolonepropionase-like amidohydrolase